MRQRVYIDTSVIGGTQDIEFARWSGALLREFHCGVRIAVVSDLTRLELEGAPREVNDCLAASPNEHLEDVYLGEEAVALADRYVQEGVVPPKHRADAQHIAIASVERVDILVSWNFRHIVNLERIWAYNSVNLKLGYPLLEIRSPREVLHEEDL